MEDSTFNQIVGMALNTAEYIGYKYQREFRGMSAQDMKTIGFNNADEYEKRYEDEKNG